MSAPLKRYIVPVVFHCEFYAEVEVEAHDAKEAAELAIQHEKLGPADGGLDWDRCEFVKRTLGDWQPIKEET